MQKKSCLSLLLSVILVLTLATSAFAAAFTDLQGHWAEVQIKEWAAKGLAGGYSDGTFKPNQEVSRAEFVALVNRAFGIKNADMSSGFADVTVEGWYYKEVAAAKAAGYIGGYSDGTFKPNQAISRQEAASILLRLLKLEASAPGMSSFADASQIQDWAKGSVGAVVTSGLMLGYPDNTFLPLKSITRAESVVVLDRAMKLNKDNGIEGKVTLDGKAISNATVRVFQAGNYQVIKEVKTDINGFYKFNLPKGKYDLTAATDKEVGFKGDINVVEKSFTSQALSLEKAAVLKGSLEDKDGRSVKNATMAFTTNPTFITTTDNSGNYTIPVLANRSYVVRAFNPEKKDQAPDIVAEGLAVGAPGTQTINAFKATFAVSGSTGGGTSTTVAVTAVTLDKTTLDLETGQQVTLIATVQPADASNKLLEWSSNNSSVARVDANGNVTAVAGGTANITVQSKADSTKKAACVVTVYKVEEVTLGTEIIDGKEVQTANVTTSTIPVRVKATATVGGKSVEFVLAVPSVASGAKIMVSAPQSSIIPQGDPGFLGLDIAVTGITGVIKVELPVPAGLANPGAFHYSNSGQIWEYREATVVNGKIVFSTNLSPVAVYKKVPVPTLTGVFDKASGAVKLNWSSVANADYRAYRSDGSGYVGGSYISGTSYNDNNITVGKTYTYYVQAYQGTLKFESDKSNEVSVTIPDRYVPIPTDHTLEALLEAIQIALNQLTDEEWENLKEQRDQLVDSLTEEEIIEALKKAGFENLVNADLTVEQARMALGVIRGLAHLGRDNVADSVGIISDEIEELKAEYSEVVAKLRNYNISQEDVYRYAVDLYTSIVNGDYLIRNDVNYEKDIYNAALDVLREHPEHADLKAAAKLSFNRLKDHYASDSSIGSILDGIVFEKDANSAPGDVELDATVILLAKKELDTRDDYDALIEAMNFMVSLSKTFMPVV